MNILKRFEDWALNNNVTIEHCSNKKDLFGNNILKRFDDLKKMPCFLDFLNYFSKIESEDQKVWFWCLNDYKESTDSNEFSWDEFEKMSESYALNEAERDKINHWWCYHLPISVSVRDDYTYIAIDFADNVGSIVMENEPFFEETTIIADNFEELLDKIISGEFIWF